MPVLPRNIPAFETLRIAGQPLPTPFVLEMRTDWNNLYDLRDYILNLFVDDETPAGPLDGQNTAFTLAAAPQPPDSLELYRNGQLLLFGKDYVLTGTNLALAVAPAATDTLVAYYRERGGLSNATGQPSAPIPSGPSGGGTGSGFCSLWLCVKDFGARGDGVADDSAAVNAAYAALPAQGGGISFPPGTYRMGSAIAFQTLNKPVMLMGDPADMSKIVFTPTSGTCLLFNYGNNHQMGHGIRNLTITGPGHGTSTIGVQIGGSQGAEGFTCDYAKIQSFGVNLQLASNTWIVAFTQSMFRDGGNNVLFPSGLTEAGENMQFNHCTFADAPTPHTNSVWIQGGGQEAVFTDCSFDQAQLRIGNGATSSAQVTVQGCHFENPNYAQPGAVNYDYIVMDNNNGNFIRISDSYFLQDQTTPGSGPARFCYFQGGVVHMSGIGMFTPIAMTNFAVLANAVNVVMIGFNDLSSGVSTLWGGATTGFMSSFPGANTGLATSFNYFIGPGDLVGGALFDVRGGNIRTNHQLISTIATGTAPLLVNSTTVVANLSINASNSITTDGQNCQYKWDHLTSGVGAWTITGNYLYPTTLSNIVLAGISSTDLTLSNGSIVSSATIACVSAATNASVLGFGVDGTAGFFNSTHSAAGTTLPMAWRIASVEQARLTTAGTWLFGLTSTDLSLSGIGNLVTIQQFAIVSATTNASVFHFGVSAGSESFIDSTASGTGTLLPITIYCGNNFAARFTTGGTFLVGATSSDFFTGKDVVAAHFCGTQSGTANASQLFLDSAGPSAQIVSQKSGTGAIQPLQFVMGSTEICRFTTGGASSLFLFQRTASSGVGAVMQVSGNIECNALNNAFGFDGTTATTTSTAILAYQGIQIHSTGSATASFLGFQCDNSSNLSQIISGRLSSGTFLALTTQVGGSEVTRILTTGHHLFNRTTDDSLAATVQITANAGGYGLSVTPAAGSTAWVALAATGGVGSIGLADNSGNSGTLSALTLSVGNATTGNVNVGTGPVRANLTNSSGVGALGVSDASSNSIVIAATSSNVTVGGTGHAGVDGETFSTNIGTRTIRRGLVCVS